MRSVILVMAAGLAVNAAVMLFDPAFWYETVPGVSGTGPLNSHFVRDIGAAFAIAATGLGWGALQPREGLPALIMGGGFLMLHAMIHLAEAAASYGTHFHMSDFVTVLLPGALIVWAMVKAQREHEPC